MNHDRLHAEIARMARDITLRDHRGFLCCCELLSALHTAAYFSALDWTTTCQKSTPSSAYISTLIFSYLVQEVLLYQPKKKQGFFFTADVGKSLFFPEEMKFCSGNWFFFYFIGSCLFTWKVEGRREMDKRVRELRSWLVNQSCKELPIT